MFLIVTCKSFFQNASKGLRLELDIILNLGLNLGFLHLITSKSDLLR